MARVLGVDACPAGWVGVVVAVGEQGPVRGRGAVPDGDAVVRVLVAADVASLVDRAADGGPLAAVGIDIPIGLPDAGRRRADVLARSLLGPRRSSVFMTPVRAALAADDHATASAVNRDLAGEGVSVQAYGLRRRIAEVERFVTGPVGARAPVVEVHPEVCFARMLGGPLSSSKATWAGLEQRRGLLARAGLVLTGELGLAGLRVGADDVLDAAAAAWTVRRLALGAAVSLPDPPEVFSDGWPTAIWV